MTIADLTTILLFLSEALGISDDYVDEFGTYLTYSFDFNRFTIYRPTLTVNSGERINKFEAELDKVLEEHQFQSITDLVKNVSVS